MKLNEYVTTQMNDFSLPENFSEIDERIGYLLDAMDKTVDYCIDPPMLKVSALVGSILGPMASGLYLFDTPIIPIPYIIPFNIALNSVIQYKKIKAQILIQSIPCTIAFFASGFMTASAYNFISN